MNTPLIIYGAIALYLLIGCIVMLVANEFSYSAITRKEFLRGMLIWPLAVVFFFEYFFGAYLARLRDWSRRRE